MTARHGRQPGQILHHLFRRQFDPVTGRRWLPQFGQSGPKKSNLLQARITAGSVQGAVCSSSRVPIGFQEGDKCALVVGGRSRDQFAGAGPVFPGVKFGGIEDNFGIFMLQRIKVAGGFASGDVLIVIPHCCAAFQPRFLA